ncbi:multiple inositol polyphosphate phosphatase 1-like [Hermetia illucens]|nr:multiple inositol polyphosphate phosphatase 1-like [Hermetia illucens]
MRWLIFSILFFISYHYKVFAQRHRTCCEEYCFVTDQEKLQTKHFSSKTAYEIVKGADYGKQYTVPYCKPVKFWLLSRHGTRLPDEKTIDKLPDLQVLREEIIKNYEVRRTKPTTGALCVEDIQLLKSWFFDKNITRDHHDYLTVQGWNDLKYLAKNYQRIFPEVLTPLYSTEKFYFRHTSSQRTQASAQAFVDGLFGENFHRSVHFPQPPNNDTLLTPYSSCSIWNEQDNKNGEPGTELFKFKTSALLNQTISDISTRLGFQYPLEYKQIKLMWDMCRLEQAWYLDRPSPWCAAFTLREIDVLEFSEDLKYQYKSGYGNEINPKVPCEIIQDMLKRLSTDSQPQVTAYFAHSSLLQLVLVALGAYRDSVLLTSDNFETMSQRKWRTSLLDPFAGNLAVIKYNCSDNTQDPSPKVIFFLNQTPLQLGWCNVGLCNWSDVMRQYEKFFNADCKETFCNLNSSGLIRGSILLTIASIVYRFIF